MQYGSGLSVDLPPCALDRAGLIELWQQIADGYDELERKRRLKVSIALPLGELTGPDLETLLDNPRVPLHFSNIQIFAAPADDKNLKLSLSNAANRLEVSGINRIWVLGQREQIKEMVGRRRPRYSIIFKKLAVSKQQALLGLLTLISVTGFGALFSIINSLKVGAASLSLASVIYIVVFIIMACLPYNRFSRTSLGQRRIADNIVAIGTVVIAILTLIGVLGIIGEAANHFVAWPTHLHV